MRSIPYACRSSISWGRITPPPPPKMRTWPQPASAKQVVHVAEVLVVAALVGRHGDALGVLLDRGLDDLAHRTVVPEVDDLGAAGLRDPAHDVDRGVVAVEQRGRGDEAHAVAQGERLGGRRGVGLAGGSGSFALARERRRPLVSSCPLVLSCHSDRQSAGSSRSGKRPGAGAHAVTHTVLTGFRPGSGSRGAFIILSQSPRPSRAAAAQHPPDGFGSTLGGWVGSMPAGWGDAAGAEPKTSGRGVRAARRRPD